MHTTQIVDEAEFEQQQREVEEVKLDDPSTAANSMSFNDQDTTSMFGGVVTVTTSLGLDEDDNDDTAAVPTRKAHRPSNSTDDSKRRKQQMFESAMKQAAVKVSRMRALEINAIVFDALVHRQSDENNVPDRKSVG